LLEVDLGSPTPQYSLKLTHSLDDDQGPLTNSSEADMRSLILQVMLRGLSPICQGLI
jgi:hypothetical protein